MESVNHVLIVGNLGRDPEIRYTANGIAVANFSIATTSKWKGQDGKDKERTEWHKVKAWGKLAEVCDELKKGDPVRVEGRLQTRSWEDKDGGKRYITEVNASSIKPLSSRHEDGPF